MTTDLKLIIYINKENFSYTIFNSNNNCFEQFKEYNLTPNYEHLFQESQNIFESDSILSKKYKKILCTIDFGTSTFIPLPLFDKKNTHHYIEPTNKMDEIKYIKQQFIDCYTLFTIPKNISEFLERKYNNIIIKPFSSLLVDYAINISNNNDNQILTQINKNNFQITFVKNGQFNFYNNFNFESTDDFLYYFMNCLHILDIEETSIKTKVITELDKNSELFRQLSNYLEIIFLERPSGFLYKNQILENEPHKNHKLFSQLICE